MTLTLVEMAIGTVSTGKTVVCQLDLNNMAAGDVAEVRCYVKTAGASGTYNHTLANTGTTAPPGVTISSYAWKVWCPDGSTVTGSGTEPLARSAWMMLLTISVMRTRWYRSSMPSFLNEPWLMSRVPV